jgi:ATP-dependent phosphoenolpyruvate carboxykinase
MVETRKLEEPEIYSEARRGNVLELVVVVSSQTGIGYLFPP